MPNPDPLTSLNPSIVGQAEKAHTAVLKRVLTGTGLGEREWITLQFALAAGEGVGRDDLINRVAAAAKFDREQVQGGIAALTRAGLVREVPGARDMLSVTAGGQEMATTVRQGIAELIGPAYGSVPPDDLATAARVLTAITQRMSEDLAVS